MFQLSPGIEIKERDLTSIIPAVATTGGGFCGSFVWGPVDQRVLIDSENNLRALFGAPADDNAYAADGINAGAVDFLTAAAFLGYGNNLQVVRVNSSVTPALNAVAGAEGITIKNEDDWETQFGVNGDFDGTSVGLFAAKYPGKLGNSISVSMMDNLGGLVTSGDVSDAQIFRVVCDEASVGEFASIGDEDPNTPIGGAYGGIAQTTTAPTANSEFKLLSKMDEDGIYTFYLQAVGTTFVSDITIGSSVGNLYVHFGQDVVFKIKKNSDNTFHVFGQSTGDLNRGTAFNVWEWGSSFEGNTDTSDYAASVNGSNDEMHIVVYDSDGEWTGTPGTVLERFSYVSKAKDAKNADGTSNYWVDVIREQSKYVWVTNTAINTDLGTASQFNVNASNTTFGSFGVRDFNLSHGINGAMPSAADYVAAYNTYFSDPETVDIQLLIGNGASTETDAKTLSDNLISIADSRKDCVAFISPSLNDTIGSTPMKDIIEFRDSLSSTSYAVMGSGWKKRFDAYNDTLRYIPLTGDIAGLCVRTDRLSDPWYSPAGFNRGQIRNVVKLSYNPTKIERDSLYASGINPVVTFPGEGSVLFGDKTLLNRPSAFDRINVRRLFIVLEKAIATASKYILFEFNDVFTRNQFKNMIEPFLRDVQGRGGITDFRVVVDSTNNPGSVIDANRLVCDIYIKPARSINFITLNFVATPTGVTFNEIVG